MAVVDPGVGTDRRILCMRDAEHRFLVPDNGLASEICRHRRIEAIYDVDWKAHIGPPPSHTFHGRDVFAPIAADLARGALLPEQPAYRRLHRQRGPANDDSILPNPENR